MKRLTVVVIAVLVVLLGAGVVFAMKHEASVDKGKALFNDAKLGTTGKSCNDCHAGGKGMDKAAGNKDLEAMINKCITQGIKGKALDAKSVEMQSMVQYIKSFGSAAAPKKKAPVGC